MKTEHRLADALKTMMAEVPLDSISVTKLAKKCHINRQTFYYHFHDIFDLLTLVFLDESVPGIEHVKTLNDMVCTIFKYYVKNKSFLDATINSAGKELFQEFIYNVCYQTTLRIVNNIPESKKLHHNDKKSVARFYSLAYSHSIVYYLSTYKNRTLDGLKNCFVFFEEDNINKAITKLCESRVKE